MFCISCNWEPSLTVLGLEPLVSRVSGKMGQFLCFSFYSQVVSCAMAGWTLAQKTLLMPTVYIPLLFPQKAKNTCMPKSVDTLPFNTLCGTRLNSFWGLWERQEGSKNGLRMPLKNFYCLEIYEDCFYKCDFGSTYSPHPSHSSSSCGYKSLWHDRQLAVYRWLFVIYGYYGLYFPICYVCGDVRLLF